MGKLLERRGRVNEAIMHLGAALKLIREGESRDWAEEAVICH